MIKKLISQISIIWRKKIKSKLQHLIQRTWITRSSLEVLSVYCRVFEASVIRVSPYTGLKFYAGVEGMIVMMITITKISLGITHSLLLLTIISPLYIETKFLDMSTNKLVPISVCKFHYIPLNDLKNFLFFNFQNLISILYLKIAQK